MVPEDSAGPGPDASGFCPCRGTGDAGAQVSAAMAVTLLLADES